MLCALGLVLGCAGLFLTELTGQVGWAIAGVALLVAAAVLLLVLVIIWRRGALEVHTDPTGFRAQTTRTRLAARWDEVTAVTATADELRIRRSGAPALVLRLPSGVRSTTLTALTDDLTAHLDQRSGTPSTESHPVTP